MRTWMLPPVERTALRWVSQGKTLAEIAMLEGKNVSEIEHYLERALASLEAKTIKEALEKANLSK